MLAICCGWQLRYGEDFSQCWSGYQENMIAGLRAWRDAPATRGKVISSVEHDGWKVEQVVSPLGIVAFVFEGRPNVFADAAGVLRTGNTAVLRIGSDALGTAQAIVTHVVVLNNCYAIASQRGEAAKTGRLLDDV